MSTKITAQNNQLWARLMIEELVRNGVDYFCISPGSRSTPLAMAVAQNKEARSFVHFDERANAFHALGFCAATKKGACLITTSGTAVANLFPAIIECSKKKLPLIVLSADRPHELRFTGANQTIDQVKIFGDYAKWFFDMPEPTGDIDPEFVLTTIDQAVYQATSATRGVVHLNCPFREPFLGETAKLPSRLMQWSKSKKPFTQYSSLKTDNTHAENLEDITRILNKQGQGLIVVGKLASEAEAKQVTKLSEKLQWPIFADLTSGLRLGNTHRNIIHHFDLCLAHKKINKMFTPKTVLHFGGRITSKRYYNFVSKVSPENYITVLNHALRNDPLHVVTHRVHSGVGGFIKAIERQLKPKLKSRSLDDLINLEKRINQSLDIYAQSQEELSEPLVARSISELIPKDHALFCAASLSVREMDAFAVADGKPVAIGANRGASGIDGTIASASGFSQGLKKTVTLLIGDLAFLYDLNALAMVKQMDKPMVIVIFNNNGGGIFNFLPIAKDNVHFEEFFGTPHNLKFKDAARMFGFNYNVPKSMQDFVKDYTAAVKSEESTIIEVKSNREYNLQIHKNIEKIISQ